MVLEVFKAVAGNYDVMNDVMSAGLHRIWKDHLVYNMLRPGPGTKHLDVAGGTGDVAFRVLEAIRRAERGSITPAQQPHVTVCDINEAMLKVGKERADKANIPERLLTFVEGNAEHLPFEDSCMDSYTISFGLRNVTHTDAALRDALRVLKPGGRFLCMEFSQVRTPVLREVYDQYSFHMIPLMGQLIANDRDSYQYLVESIRKFPEQEVLADMMREAGFANVEYTNIIDGVVSIHSGYKL